MHKKVSFSRVGVFVLIALALLGLSRWSARATVPGTAGQGYGAISVDPTTNNIAVGTSTALSSSVFTIYSTSSVTDSMKILNSSGATVFRFSNGDMSVGGSGIDANYSITTAGGGIKAENSTAGQPAGYFNNTAGGASIVATGLIQSNANGAAYLKGGDDATINDVNVANTVGLVGAQDSTKGCVQFGNSASTYICGISSGNIGVGTVGPAYKLDVVGQVNSSGGLCIAGDCKTAWSQVTGTNYWTTGSGIIYPTTAASIGVGSNAGAIGGTYLTGSAGSPVSGRLTFGTDGTGWQFRIAKNQAGTITDLVTVATNGNVGINNTSPGNTLSVSGTIWNNGISYLNANNGVESIQTAGIRGANNGVQQVNMYDRLSIGTPSGWNVFPNAPSGGLYTYGGAVLAGNNGNVGVGTASPSYKLDVQGGQVNASGGLCIAGDCKTAWSQVSGGTYTGGTGIIISGTNIGVDTEDWADLSVRAPYVAGYGSGFYQTSAPTGGWPSGASGWWHLINSQHTNTANNYAMQIAGGFYDQTFYGRKTAGSGTTAWSRFITTDPGSTQTTLPGVLRTINAASTWGDIQTGAIDSNTVYAYGSICTGNNSGTCGSTGGIVLTPGGRQDQANSNLFWQPSEGAGLMLKGNNGTKYFIENLNGVLRGVNDPWNSEIWKFDQSGNLTLGGGAAKLNVGTIDPIYTIGGVNYATYVSGMTGQKEETAGKLSFKCYAGEKCSAVIDFANAEKGSDLWLFSKATNLSKSYDSMLVYLTPSFEGDVWYKKDASSNRLTVFAKPSESGDLEVSYRLTAPRFDAAKWTNYAEKDAKGLRPEEQ